MFSLCRLCAKYQKDIELTTQITDLQSKLSMCCGWKPSENESQMPQKACSLCVDRLNKSWEFAETVWTAEQQLHKLSSELNQSSPNEPVPHTEEILAEASQLELDISIIKTSEYEMHEIPIDGNDDDCPTESDDDESSSDRLPNQSIETSGEQKNKESSETDTFLSVLNSEERLSDGTISAQGVAKLEKLCPEMATISWNDCQFECDKCNRIFQGPHNFYTHNRCIHYDDVNSMELSCFYCVFKYRREHALIRHIAMEHFEHLEFRCLYCTDYFWNASELNKHQNMHTDVEHKCELCEQTFFQRKTLNAHVEQTHYKKKLNIPKGKFGVVCDQCGLKLKSKYYLEVHIATKHSDEKPFACKQCDKKFKTKNLLAKHSKRHEDFKPLECKLCSKQYRQLCSLRAHTKCHDNTYYPYECKYCDRKFRYSSSLKHHERVHTNDKPYACEYCDYRSTKQQNVQKHTRRIHSTDLRTKKTQDKI